MIGALSLCRRIMMRRHWRTPWSRKNITRFLLELGTGFAFVGRQKEIIVAGKTRKIDMLFYHIRLRCYVVYGNLKPGHPGQKNPDGRILKQKMRITAKIIRDPYASAVPSDRHCISSAAGEY